MILAPAIRTLESGEGAQAGPKTHLGSRLRYGNVLKDVIGGGWDQREK